MKLTDIINGAWAIEPDMLNEITGIYATHLRGEKIDIPKVEAALGRPLANQQADYYVQDGVAVIEINGVIAKKANLFSQISGGASTQIIGRQIEAACDDPAVQSILLHIDSPGGTVDGTQTLANIVAGCAKKKPMAALADGVMASAAYWIGSAAGEVFMADDTTRVGSIGVVATHRDISGWEEKQGLKTSEIVAGKYKRVTSQYGALSDDGRNTIQTEVDHIYSLFVDAVAANRGVSPDVVTQNMADGRVFTGSSAIAAGLVDGVATLPQMIDRMKQKQPGASLDGHITIDGEETIMNIQELQEKHPDIYQEACAAGAAEERARIAAINGLAVAGHDALVKQCIADGISAGDTAIRIIAADKEKLAHAAADFAAGGAPAVPNVETSGQETADVERASITAAAVAAANGTR